jgi:hypothetical protein
MSIRQGAANTTLEFEAEPAIVAQACQDVLGRVGRVKVVSRETGTISGKVDAGLMAGAADINLRIAKKANLTELSIHTSRAEGLLTSGGAEKAMAAFTEALGKDERLAGKATGGW